jgi:hypothetical protein
MRNGLRTSGLTIPHVVFGGLAGGVITNQTIAAGTTSISADIKVKNCKVTGKLRTFDTNTGNCYKLIVSDTLTLDSTGTITCDANEYRGTNWQNSLGSVGFNRDGSLGGSGSGGDCSAGDTAWPGLPSGAIPRIYLGGNGGDGGTITNAGALGGGKSLLAISPVNTIFSTLVSNQAMLWVNPVLITLAYEDWTGEDINSYVAAPLCGGCGGGGAGNTTEPSDGGGGCGGGVIYICADRLVLNGGAITADGQTCKSNSGGGGGCIIIVCNELLWNSTDTNIGAVGGTGGGFGAGNGSDGTVIIFSNQLVASFTGTVTKPIYEQAVIDYSLKGIYPVS